MRVNLDSSGRDERHKFARVGFGPAMTLAAGLMANAVRTTISRLRGRVTLDDASYRDSSTDALGEKGNPRPSAAVQVTDALLAVVHERYPRLGGHTSGVAKLARAVAERSGLDAAAVDATVCAAALHDVGKVAIPDEILDKPGPLDGWEWELMRRHTAIGERVLRSVPALCASAPLVRWSHERWDGRGYPDALSGDQIPFAASIVAACDSYEAMTEDRSYQPSKTPSQALAELRRCSGTQFRPEVVETLCSVVEDPVSDSAPSGARRSP